MADPTGWTEEDAKIRKKKQLAVAAHALYNKIAVVARQDINVFIEFVFRFKQAECHRKMQAHMDTHKRAGILAQKELGKTSQAVARLLHRLGNHPDMLIKLLCASDDLAVDRVMLIRDLISRNKYLKIVFPQLVKSPWIDDWGKKSLTIKRNVFSKDSSIEACGILTSGTGGRADEILFDDVVDFMNAIKYPTQRKQVKETFQNVWIPLLGPNGRAAYLATLHHEDDLTHELMKNKEWNWIDLSVTGDPPVSHWPAKWTTSALLSRQAEMGSIEFDRSMRNILHPDKERIVQEGWIRKFSIPPPRPDLRVSSWDFAASGGEGDWTARALIDINSTESTMRVLRVDRWRGMTYNEMIELLISDFTTWTPDDILIESTGFQVIMGRDERITTMPIKRVVPSVGKEQRVKQTAVFYERGFITFQDGSCELAINELLGFPKASHDDMVDALTQGLLRGIEKMGRPFNPDAARGTGARIFSPSSGPVEMPRIREVEAAGSSRSGRRIGFGGVKW